jgi:hypothetical protein
MEVFSADPASCLWPGGHGDRNRLIVIRACSRSECPAMSTLGSVRSSRRGGQAATAERQMTTGGIVIRTRNASTRTPKERAKQTDLMVAWAARINPAKTEVMMSAAAVTARAHSGSPTPRTERNQVAWPRHQPVAGPGPSDTSGPTISGSTAGMRGWRIWASPWSVRSLSAGSEN